MATIQRIAAFPLANYNDGVYDSPVVMVPDNATKVYFEVARCTDADPTIWPNSTTLFTFTQEVSLDGEATWQVVGQVGPIGGGINRRYFPAGQPTAGFEVSLPDGVGRRVRGRVTITGGPLRSQGYIEFRN